jgi:hypothetical protein
VPVVAGGVLITIFALERILLRLAGDPVDEDLVQPVSAEVEVQRENAGA